MQIYVQFPQGKKPKAGGKIGSFFLNLFTPKIVDRSGLTVDQVNELGKKGNGKSKKELQEIAKDRTVSFEVAKLAVDKLEGLGGHIRMTEVARSAQSQIGIYVVTRIEHMAVNSRGFDNRFRKSSLMALALHSTSAVTSLGAVEAMKRLGDVDRLELVVRRAKNTNVSNAAQRALDSLQ